MTLPPQKFREIVFQILFSAQFNTENLDDTAFMLMSILKVTKRSVLNASLKAQEVLSLLEEIDQKISDTSHEYQFSRISSAEKCALRLGCFELLYDPSIPNKVVIAEAIRLTRKFGALEGADFVNAILDNLHKTDSEEKTDSEQRCDAVS